MKIYGQPPERLRREIRKAIRGPIINPRHKNNFQPLEETSVRQIAGRNGLAARSTQAKEVNQTKVRIQRRSNKIHV